VLGERHGKGNGASGVPRRASLSSYGHFLVVR
jgi:hypothetical protein